MSHSKYEYVKQFESDDRLLPNTWIVVRIDGKGFHKFSDAHSFAKPNDKPALDLMNACARRVLDSWPELVLAYGQSDEYSFVFRKDAQVYSRRAFKLATNIASLFSAAYVMSWQEFFPSVPLAYPPAFDARAVTYPTNQNLRDYLSWRQADCHINNLYNTVFWALIQKGGLTNREAMERLKGTVSGDKNEILFSQFGINYNNEPEQFRKGTVLYKKRVELPVEGGEGPVCQSNPKCEEPSEGASKRERCRRAVTKIRPRTFEETTDIIGEEFWQRNSHILDPFKDS